MAFIECVGGRVSQDKLMPSIVVKSSGVEVVNAQMGDAMSVSSGAAITTLMKVKNNISCTLRLTPYNLGGSLARFYVNGNVAYSVSGSGSANYGEWNITLNKDDEIYAYGIYGNGSHDCSVVYTLKNIKCI